MTDLLNTLSDEEVSQFFYPEIQRCDETKELPNFQKIYTNLSKYKDRSLYHEWYNFRKEHPNTYSYSWMATLYNMLCSVHRIEPVLLMNETAGQCMYVDWAGRKMNFFFDGYHQTEVHFSLATLTGENLRSKQEMADD